MFPRPELDHRSDTPLYRQLFDHIKGLIESGRLGRGDRLPATRELAGLLGLNRATVSAAYEMLEAERLIEGHVGRGSFVAAGPSVESSGLDWDRLCPAPPDPVPSPGPAPQHTISFATSRPAEDLFPLDEFRAASNEVISGAGASTILQLGSPYGYAPLRRYLLDQARSDGTARGGDEILITSGCQQALDLIERVLAGAGVKIAVEDPIYPGLKSLFGRAGAELLGVPVGEDGIDTAHLERVLARERPKLLVATPNFQNPTGATMPLPARLVLLRAARESGAVVIENDIYGALRYEGQPAPSLKQLDETGDVIQLGSFSKVAFPGLRVGWVIAPRALVSRLAEAKQWCDLHTDQLSQAILLRFAESGRLEAHRRRIVAAGRERLSATLAACRRFLPPGTRFTHPQGGMNVWVRLPAPLDAAESAVRAEREGVSYLPGRYFAVARHEPGSLRLSFAGLEPGEIERGLAILGNVFSAELGRPRSLGAGEPATAMV